MRRPLTFVFLAYMLGIASSYMFSPIDVFYVVGVVVFSIIILISVIVKQSNLIIFFLVLLLIFNIGGLVCSKELSESDGMEQYLGTKINYEGVGVKYQYKEKDFQKVTVQNGGHKYLLHIYGEGVEPENIIGCNVVFSGEVELPSTRRNPGCFDYRLYLKTINVRSIIKCDAADIIFIDPDFAHEPLGYLLNKLAIVKYDYLKKMKGYMSSQSYGLLTGMLFGSKDYMEDDTYEAFQKNGVAHILSVSGIHVGIVYGFIFMLLRKRIIFFNAVIIIIFLLAYAAMAEFSPSVIRAAVMIIVHMISKLIHRPYDLLTGTCLAALLMLIINPLNLFHVGFQLSFLAVILLAFFIPFLKRYVGKKKIMGIYKERYKSEDAGGLQIHEDTLKKKAVESLLPLVILQIGMAPFSIFVFNHFSMSGLILNIPIIAVAGLIIPVGICLIPISLMSMGGFTDFLLSNGGKFLDLILSLMVHVNDLSFSFKFSWIQVVSPPVFLLIAFYGMLFFLSSESFRIMKNRGGLIGLIPVILVIIMVSISCSLTSVGKQNQSDIVFVDVGQGDSIHLRTPSGKNILIDGGGSVDYDVGKKTLLPYFLKNGVSKLDYVFVTHLHTDHFRGIKELSNYMDIGKFITFDGNKVRPGEIMDGSGIKKESIVYAGQGDRYNLDRDVYVDFLYPEKRSDGDYLDALSQKEDENKNSLFMKLNYRGLSVLITGDLDEEGERLIMNDINDPAKALKSDILKVGHHGSKYSTSQEFLDHVDPKYAVIQVGDKNTYGHPAPSVIEKLDDKGIMVYRNDLDGAVMIDYKNGRPSFKKMIYESD